MTSENDFAAFEKAVAGGTADPATEDTQDSGTPEFAEADGADTDETASDDAETASDAAEAASDAAETASDDEPADDDDADEVDKLEAQADGQKVSYATFKRRLNREIEKRRAAEARAEELAAKTEQPAAQSGTPQAEIEPDPQEPDPAKYDFGEIDPKYIADLTEYRIEKRLTEREAAAKKQAEEQALLTGFRERVMAPGMKIHDDFYDKVVVGAQNNAWTATPEMANLLVSSEQGAEIAYHLASNPEVSAKMAKMSPLELGRSFGALEAQFSSGGDGKPAKKSTKAPTPPKTQAAGRGSAVQPGPSTSNFSEFERWAKKQGL